MQNRLSSAEIKIKEAGMQNFIQILKDGFEHLKLVLSTEVLVRMGLYLLAAVLIGFGIYMLMLYSAKLPTRKSQQALVTVSNLDKGEEQTTINKMLGGLSKKVILHFVELSDSTKYKLETALSYFHYNVSPEEHFSDAMAAGICVAIIAMFLGIIHPLFIPVGIVMGFLIFKSELNAPSKRLDVVRQNIDYDASVFCKFIADALKEGNRNVIDILTSCKESVSTDFKLELEHTLTDMKTGNQEQALIDMSKRLNISSLTQIVVGLLGVLRGDNQTNYFEMLYEKFYKEELAKIKKKNSIKVGAVSKVTMILILPVVGMILIGVILVLVEQLKTSGMF